MSENSNTPRISILRSNVGTIGENSLEALRERSLTGISWFIVVAGLLLLGISIPENIAKGEYLTLGFDLLGFGTLLVLTIFQKRVPFQYRALALILVTLSQGIADFFDFGLLGDSRIWVIFSVTFTTILLGFRAGMIANMGSIVGFIIGAVLVSNGFIILNDPEYQILTMVPGHWFDVLPIMIMSQTFINLTIGQIIQGMEINQRELTEAYSGTQALSDQLTSEQERLSNQTAALEKRTRYIETAAEVGRTATSIYNIDEMLDQVVDMISERFGFYQTGIFLLDERSEFAEMVAASSEGGKRMLARDHKLRVGQEGMVGDVTSQGQARIALDIGDEAVHFSNPELPLTRSEMTLPLFYGGRIFGALDVQSTMEHAFTQEDISSLTVLADQVSMAINNARLFEELQSSLQSERQAFGEVSRQAWHNLIRRTGSWGYRFSNDRTSAAEKEWPQEMVKAMERKEMVIATETNGALSIPIMVSNAPVGVIKVEKPAGSVDWTDDEIDLMKILTDRLSQALESARVYQASQSQTIQEQLTTEISGQLRQTLDIDTVLKTAAKQLGDAFNAKEVVIRMAPDESRN